MLEPKTNDAEALRLQGNVLFKQKKYEQTLGCYSQAIKLDPNMREAWFNMGFVLKIIDKSDKALEAFTKAIEIDPKYIKALWHKSDILLAQGRLKEALSGFEQVLEIDPNNREALASQATCLKQMQAQMYVMPELFIDLHGYSPEQAKARILHVLASVQGAHKIRVITGRGNHSRNVGISVLYKEFYSWLTESVYQHRIEKVTTHDGYYEVYLNDSIPQHNKRIELPSLNELIRDIKAVKTAADIGDPQSQFLYAAYLASEIKNYNDFKEAFKYYLHAAEQDHVSAMIEVATCYMMGKGVKQNDEQAVFWLQKALPYEKFQTPLMLADCYTGGYGVVQNHEQAFHLNKLAAEHGHPIATRRVANAYLGGYGTEKNLQLSFTWYKKAADMGDVMAQYNVAVMYEQGRVGEHNPKEAYNYFLKAANGGDPDAQAKVGFYYLQGMVVQADEKEAKYWLEMASRNGSAQANALLSRSKDRKINPEFLARSAQAGNIFDLLQRKLSDLGEREKDQEVVDRAIQASYLESRDIEIGNLIKLEQHSKFFLIDLLLDDKNKKYRKKAMEALEIMAQDNCTSSLRRLAYAYRHGQGVQKNNQLALSYLEQASKLGDSESAYLLGNIYEKGINVQKSINKALGYFHQATDCGYLKAIFYLGVIYCEGKVVVRDIVKGISYLKKVIELADKNPKDIKLKQQAAFRIFMYLIKTNDDQAFGYLALAQKLGSPEAEQLIHDMPPYLRARFCAQMQMPEEVTTTTTNILKQLSTPDSKPVDEGQNREEDIEETTPTVTDLDTHDEDTTENTQQATNNNSWCSIS